MKRKMLPFSPELTEYLEERIQKYGYPAVKKKMFGHEVFFLNGYMFSGANVDGIFVHIEKAERDRALENSTDVGTFEPMEGMIMKEYLLLRKPAYSSEGRLKEWLDKSSAYLNSLPSKMKKAKKKP